MNKAEDLFVFHHSLNLTRILYVSSVLPDEWQAFLAQSNSRLDKSLYLTSEPLNITAVYLQKLCDFILQHPFEHHRHRYGIREHKIAAVMSCGKNFAVRKTAGREIPWQTPDALNNIIHFRLTTGSVVEQMNAHPFARLHTALTRNVESTNYEALKQRLELLNCIILDILFLSNVRRLRDC